MSDSRYHWVAALLLCCATGCQCSVLTHYYSDAIDDVTDHDLEMDAWYRPQWDLNRIGKPDWCQSAWNRFWCRCHGCGSCDSCRSRGSTSIEHSYQTREEDEVTDDEANSFNLNDEQPGSKGYPEQGHHKTDGDSTARPSSIVPARPQADPLPPEPHL